MRIVVEQKSSEQWNVVLCCKRRVLCLHNHLNLSLHAPHSLVVTTSHKKIRVGHPVQSTRL